MTAYSLPRDGPLPDRAVIPPAILAGVLDIGRREGLPVRSWFSGTGLDPAMFDERDARVSLEQARLVLRRALDAFPGRPLGIEVGERDPLLSFGFVGIAMRASQTLGEGLSLAIELHRAAGSLLDVEHEDLGPEMGLRFRERWPDADILAFLCEEALVSTMVVIRSMLAEPTWTPTRVHLSYAPPPRLRARYHRSFGCPVQFAADGNRMVFPRALSDRPLPARHEPTRQAAVEVCRQFLAIEEGPSDIVASVEALVSGNLRRPLTMSDVAGRLYITERTLHRRLLTAGERFSRIRDRVRERRATALLQHTAVQVADVAAEVGFNDGREFRRAYARWTGRTPTEVRNVRRTGRSLVVRPTS